MTNVLPPWLVERLACPRDGLPVRLEDVELQCEAGHHFAMRGAVVVLLLADRESTHPGLQPTGERRRPQEPALVDQGANDAVDAYVQDAVQNTCGNFYKGLIGKLNRYPIPELRVAPQDGRGKHFLDIGCNWGRWSIAASRAGYRAVGIDPNVEAVRAAWRVSHQLKSGAAFLTADARWLPFGDNTFDVVFSYSVLQHFRRSDVRTVLDEIARVLVPGGLSVVEMPTALGARNIWVRAQRTLARKRLDEGDFHVRYWSLAELIQTFSRHVGPTRAEPDSFFFINGQPADRDLLPLRYRMAITASEALRSASRAIPGMVRVADSVYLASEKRVNAAG